MNKSVRSIYSFFYQSRDSLPIKMPMTNPITIIKGSKIIRDMLKCQNKNLKETTCVFCNKTISSNPPSTSQAIVFGFTAIPPQLKGAAALFVQHHYTPGTKQPQGNFFSARIFFYLSLLRLFIIIRQWQR